MRYRLRIFLNLSTLQRPVVLVWILTATVSILRYLI